MAYRNNGTNVVEEALNGSYHLGHYIIDVLSSHPRDVKTIDASSGQQETNASVLSRSIRLARCFVRAGMKPGDVLALVGRNHLDLNIPFYAACMVGMPIAGGDPFWKTDELRSFLKLVKPKIIFCDRELADEYTNVIQVSLLDTIIVTFHEGSYTIEDYMDSYKENKGTEELIPVNFDGNKVFCWLVSTSGTTDLPKVAAFNHTQVIEVSEGYKSEYKGKLIPNTYFLNLSSVQWLSAYINAIVLPVMRTTSLQTSAELTVDHVIDVIQQYKPISTLVSPSILNQIINSPKSCNLSSFKLINITGSKVSQEFIDEVKTRAGPSSFVRNIYGQTETLGPIFKPTSNTPPGSVGVPETKITVKLVSIETDQDIKEANSTGELWVKGRAFVEYYMMPQQTENAFSEDGWLKTGDMFYRDDNGFYFYVERLKLLIKCKGYQIQPSELEDVISKLDGVAEVAVTSIEDPSCCELPVACVVIKEGASVSAEQIKRTVAVNLSDMKKLRGGVVFLEEIPKTTTGKIARKKLKDIVKTADRL